MNSSVSNLAKSILLAIVFATVSTTAFSLSAAQAATAQALHRLDFRLESVSCARCILNIRKALRANSAIVKCEIALRKPYGGTAIYDSAKITPAKISEIIKAADPASHAHALDLIDEPVSAVPAVLMPKHNSLAKTQ